VYWSAPLVALVPSDVVTVMSTVPTLPAGAVTFIDVPPALTEFTVAAVAPNFTVLLAGVVLKLVPVMVTELPPPVGPLVGLMPVTVGDVAGNVTEKAKGWLAEHGLGSVPSLQVYRLKLSAAAPPETEISFMVMVSMPCPPPSTVFQVTK
jgi:hypothetical protein